MIDSRVRPLAIAMVGIAMLATLGGCGSSGTVDGTSDASKLDDAMEQQAIAIEQRANAAAQSAEQAASAELTRLEAEARSAPASDDANQDNGDQPPPP